MPCIMDNEKFIKHATFHIFNVFDPFPDQIDDKENQEKPENNTSTLWYSTESKNIFFLQ